MKIASFLLTITLLLVAVAPVDAVLLRGVVIEVRDGQSLVVFSGGRKFTVLLKGVDAPELDQDFGDAAREHLAYLVLNKPVEMDFSQLQGDHVIGKVTCNRIDVGLQVIRDGTAWYDKVAAPYLSEVERGLYGEAQELARNEQRGLWQDGTPMPPWEWRRVQAAKHSLQVTYKNSNGRTLQTEDLVFAKRAPIATSNAIARSDRPLPKPTSKPFNTPGQDAEFRGYLNQGRISIVYFYADWCPACRKLTPVMDEVNSRISDMQVIFMNIEDWNTPVAQQYGVNFVPYLRVYDKTGNLVAEGREAKAWLQQAMADHN